MAFVQRKQVDGANFITTIAATFNSTASAGSLLIAEVQSQTASNITNIEDGNGNNFVQAGLENSGNGFNFSSIWYLKNAPLAVSTITAHLSSGGQYQEIVIYEVAGADTSAPLSTTNQDSGTTDPGVGTSFTVTGTMFICAWIFDIPAGTPGNSGSYIVHNFNTYFNDAYHDGATSNEAVQFANPGNGAWWMVSAAFKMAAGGGTTVTLGQSSAVWTGRALSPVNAKTMKTLAQASWVWTGRAYAALNIKSILGQASWVWTGRALTLNVPTTIPLGQSSSVWTGRALGVNAKFMLTLAAASWVWTGRALSYVLNKVIILVQTIWNWSARAWVGLGGRRVNIMTGSRNNHPSWKGTHDAEDP